MKYDVVLSFSGQDRHVVDEVAHELRRRSVAVFYDSFERTETWGKHLPTHLRDVYERHGRFAVVFLSKHYLDTGFTELEFRSALDRTLGERIEYILPVLLDGTHHPRLSNLRQARTSHCR